MLTAEMIMTENVITIKESATLEQAAKKMLQKGVGTLLVTKNNLPIASIGKKEMVEASLKSKARQCKIKEIMDTNFVIIEPTHPYNRIKKVIKSNIHIRCPVVEDNKLVGIVTEADVMNAARDFTKNEQIKQDITLAVFGLITALFLFLFSPMGQKMFGL